MTIFLNLINAIWLIIFLVLNPLIDPESKKKFKKEIYQHISYLASDQLKGRGIGTPELDQAADYIAMYFKKIGVKPVPANNGYFQEFDLIENQGPESILLKINDHSFSLNQDLILLNGSDSDLLGIEIAFVDFGYEKEVQPLDMKGKIILTRMGYSDKENFESYFAHMEEKRESIQKQGAVALIEIYQSERIPWQQAAAFLGRERLSIPDDNPQFIHLFVNDSSMITNLNKDKPTIADLSIEMAESKKIKAKNVVGYIEGTDDRLKDEYVLLGAHYDHVGIGRPIERAPGKPDSIYNGARDNAAGTVAIMIAAKVLVKNPPKRPVLFIAFTAEESGMLGSRYYASHPLIPLEKTIFCFNNDNGGYNDTSVSTVVGTSRIDATSKIEEGVEKAGLQLFSSNALESEFFTRSDNISLSVKGVPSATYSLGFRKMDGEITKYYHQPTDEVESMDMDYVTQWIIGYINAAQNIANMDERPFWNTGDEFESIGRKLYQLD